MPQDRPFEPEVRILIKNTLENVVRCGTVKIGEREYQFNGLLKDYPGEPDLKNANQYAKQLSALSPTIIYCPMLSRELKIVKDRFVLHYVWDIGTFIMIK